MKENDYTQNFTYKVWQEKNNFISKNILLYSSHRDKTLSTFKKEVKNGGIGSQLNPKNQS